MIEPADPSKKDSTESWEIVKLVYERAEENAYHDDILMWEVTSIVWGANTLLLGFILEAIGHAKARPLIVAVSIIGIFLTVFVFRFFLLGKVGQRVAYNLCHDIEENFPEDLRLHTRIRETYERGVTPWNLWGHRIGRAHKWVVVLSAVFLAGWLVVLGWAVWLQWFQDGGATAILSATQDSIAITVKRGTPPSMAFYAFIFAVLFTLFNSVLGDWLGRSGWSNKPWMLTLMRVALFIGLFLLVMKDPWFHNRLSNFMEWLRIENYQPMN